MPGLSKQPRGALGSQVPLNRQRLSERHRSVPHMTQHPEASHGLRPSQLTGSRQPMGRGRSMPIHVQGRLAGWLTHSAAREPRTARPPLSPRAIPRAAMRPRARGSGQHTAAQVARARPRPLGGQPRVPSTRGRALAATRRNSKAEARPAAARRRQPLPLAALRGGRAQAQRRARTLRTGWSCA